MNKYRIPRKAKKKIPKGMYCYTPVKMDWATGVYNIQTCEFYRPIPGDFLFGRCSLIKEEVMDQCKSCGVKYGF